MRYAEYVPAKSLDEADFLCAFVVVSFAWKFPRWVLLCSCALITLPSGSLILNRHRLWHGIHWKSNHRMLTLGNTLRAKIKKERFWFVINMYSTKTIQGVERDRYRRKAKEQQTAEISTFDTFAFYCDKNPPSSQLRYFISIIEFLLSEWQNKQTLTHTYVFQHARHI